MTVSKDESLLWLSSTYVLVLFFQQVLDSVSKPTKGPSAAILFEPFLNELF